MGNFRELQAWKEAKTLAVDIYKNTQADSLFHRDFRFKDQIRSAAVSISSNIAEGDELKTDKQSVSFFYIAKGSTAELINLLIIAEEIGYLPEQKAKSLITQCEAISKMLHALIKYRSS